MKRLNWLWAWVLVASSLGETGCADSDASGALALSDNDAISAAMDAPADGAAAKGDVEYASDDSDLMSTGAAQDANATPQNTDSAWKGGGVGLTLPGPQNTAKFRALVAAGKVPQPADFPMGGWLNEHHAVLPAADPSHPVDLHPIASLHSTPAGAAEVLIQLGINTAKSLQELQPPVAMVLLVDKSGSLGTDGWLAVQQQIPQLAERLPEGSWLAVVGFSSGAETAWPMAAWQNWQGKQLGTAIQGLKMGDGTDLYVGIEAAVQELAKAPAALVQRRILLISDGAITKGDHTPADVLALAKASKISFSTVAYGKDAQVALLGKLATATAGTSYSAPTPAVLVEVLSKHAATLLVAVAENLGIRLQLSPGWQLLSAYELPISQDGDQLTIGESANQRGQADAGAAGPDVSGPPTDSTPSINPGVLAHALYPASHNGLVVLKIKPPAGLTLNPSSELLAAKVEWSYALSKDHLPKSHAAAIKILGLVAVPDGGYEFFSHPEARRTYAIVAAGEAIQGALDLAQAGNGTEGLPKLDAAADLLAAVIGKLEIKTADPAGDLDDAVDLVVKLRANLAAQKGSAP